MNTKKDKISKDTAWHNLMMISISIYMIYMMLWYVNPRLFEVYDIGLHKYRDYKFRVVVKTQLLYRPLYVIYDLWLFTLNVCKILRNFAIKILLTWTCICARATVCWRRCWRSVLTADSSHFSCWRRSSSSNPCCFSSLLCSSWSWRLETWFTSSSFSAVTRCRS